MEAGVTKLSDGTRKTDLVDAMVAAADPNVSIHRVALAEFLLREERLEEAATELSEAMRIDAEKENYTPAGRPVTIVNKGIAVDELLG